MRPSSELSARNKRGPGKRFEVQGVGLYVLQGKDRGIRNARQGGCNREEDRLADLGLEGFSRKEAYRSQGKGKQVPHRGSTRAAPV